MTSGAKEGIVAFCCGLIFALGLGISGMTQPGVVTAFLDIFGNWDPRLLFVMGGAVLVYSIGYRIVVKSSKPLIATQFQIPKLRRVDRPLAVGSILFGIGWGLAGFCPGPALTSIASFGHSQLVFVVAMFIGMAIFEVLDRRKKT